MNIEQAKTILEKELRLMRTPKGNPIHEKALAAIESSLQDTKNYGNEVVQCGSCGFVVSILLVEEGCPNCNYEVLKTNIVE